jgi:hypothetical protein
LSDLWGCCLGQLRPAMVVRVASQTTNVGPNTGLRPPSAPDVDPDKPMIIHQLGPTDGPPGVNCQEPKNTVSDTTKLRRIQMGTSTTTLTTNSEQPKTIKRPTRQDQSLRPHEFPWVVSRSGPRGLGFLDPRPHRVFLVWSSVWVKNSWLWSVFWFVFVGCFDANSNVWLCCSPGDHFQNQNSKNSQWGEQNTKDSETRGHLAWIINPGGCGLA